MIMKRFAAVILSFSSFCLFPATTNAGEVQVAVASNFSKPMTEIAALFQQESGHEAKLSFGSSGKLTAQISHGAPFDVFLSADTTKPALLVEKGLAQADSVFTYASGQLVLWSAKAGYVDEQGKILSNSSADFRHLALASPELAPYGEAARQVLENLQLTEQLQERVVTGENISQAYQFVQSANAELGFVAASQVMQDGQLMSGSVWRIPAQLYQPINQDAVLLNRGRDNPAAGALLDFLRGEAVEKVLIAYGYQVDSNAAAEPEIED